MNLYVREIKPYIDPPALQGMNCNMYPVDGYDWVNEDMEEQLRKEIVVSDSWSTLVFKERYIEVGETWKSIWLRNEDYDTDVDEDDDNYDDFWYEDIGK